MKGYVAVNQITADPCCTSEEGDNRKVDGRSYVVSVLEHVGIIGRHQARHLQYHDQDKSQLFDSC